MQNILFRKAFSMLELIFVIVILGIVSAIGSEVIAKVYTSYITQRAVHNASIKTELAINTIANRLTYRIDTSVVAHQPGLFGIADTISLRALTPAQANTHRALEWIGYDNDGFSTQGAPAPAPVPVRLPAWSGFADLNPAVSNFNNLRSTGSDFAAENAILGNLFPNMNNPAIVFMNNNYTNPAGGDTPYTANCLHRVGNVVPGCIFPVQPAITNLQLLGGLPQVDRVAGNMLYSEFYQLAASAYAVVPLPLAGRNTANGTPVWDLHLFYDYQPWEGAPETYPNGSQALLLRNVSVFRFTQEGNSVRLKICSIESIGDSDISICKEKAVIR